MTNYKKNINTSVVHSANFNDEPTGSLNIPVYLTSTYKHSSPGQYSHYDYSRAGNPTRTALEETIATLEHGAKGYAFASGMAAITTILMLLQPNDHIIVSHDLYGGSYRYLTHILEKNYKISVSYIDTSDLDALNATLTPSTKMIWVETPSNPTLALSDLTQIADFAKQHQLISVVDNTFSSPILQQPLDYDIDIVVHSATKFINGHCDVIAGLAVINNDRPELIEKISFYLLSSGAILSPMDAFLVLRGIKTMAIRVERSCYNAMKIATFLENHPKIETVIYPGLSSHPQHKLATKQMKDYGGIVSVLFKGSTEEMNQFIKKTKIFSLAESLGGVESLINVPTLMTHAAIPEVQKKNIGIHPTLLRLSIGIEAIDDLINDLTQALG